MQPAKKSSAHALSSAEIKQSINRAYHLDENLSVEEHLSLIPLSAESAERVQARTRKMVEHVRENPSGFGGVDKFMAEFGLTTKEGVALMCLAEALLRIPDADTANKLISDKIGTADWDRHIGKASDLLVNASTWALALTGRVVSDLSSDKSSSLGGLVSSIVSRLGEPVVRRATLFFMKMMGQQFVMGRTIDEALKRAEDDEKMGYRHSFDMLGEGARTMEDADRYFGNYASAIDAIGKKAAGRGPVEAPGISVKLSALHPRYEYGNRDAAVPYLTGKLTELARKCAHYGIGLTVDAEEAHRLEMSMDIIGNTFADPALKGWEGFGLAIQSYHKRCSRLIDWLSAIAEENNNRMMVRLVKGAYWDSEIKYAQVNGLPGYPVFTRKASTDVSYLACASKLLARRDLFYPMLATHNAFTISAILEMAGTNQGGFEFQRLHGMGEELYNQITGQGPMKYPCRIYAPVGSHQDLLPYLVRRLLENGANSNFVSQLQNEKVPIEKMLVNPVEQVRALGSKPHPKIPLPVNLYGAERKNSKGIEFANSDVSVPFLAAVDKHAAKTFTAAPIIDGQSKPQGAKAVFDPSDRRRKVGDVAFATEADIKNALASVHKGFKDWSATPADKRAACLEKCADLMEENLAELSALCVREAGKTLPDAIAEVREAVDFCRYYAVQGRHDFNPDGMLLPGPTGESNRLILEGRGVFLCISPWNFPLAIFMGQVSAALMAGNTVIAKPSEQTCLIADYAVRLLLKAGVPGDAIALLPATGEMTGQHLTPDLRIAGICFTGSTEVAQIINRTLANRGGAIIPLIAETGGQNAMIADSSALPEQIVDDAITSAFRSAGQRCSALRVLFVQDGIADKVVHMLAGASQLLKMADPIQLSTDIGPVIDEAALKILQDHATRMDSEAKKVAEVPLPASCANGVFFAPRAYEISSLSQLPREVFGPVLHIIRYKADDLPKMISEINNTGYGLTFGVHTRIDYTAQMLCQSVRAGNCYVNRSMIGAVVGVQPFGGSGLSGTGPKAGGPFYLHRFAGERTVTVNTTASGGNTTLVSLDDDA